jgi:hypothetical protein
MCTKQVWLGKRGGHATLQQLPPPVTATNSIPSSCSYRFISAYLFFLRKYRNFDEIHFTLYSKVLFMDSGNEPARALNEIKQMMERNSRFVSLSGWSGIAAGICALVAAWVAGKKLDGYEGGGTAIAAPYPGDGNFLQLQRELLLLALITFITAFFFAFLYTYLRSRKAGVPIWGFTARRVMINVAVPMIIGGLLIWRMADFGLYGLVAPACLLFYGLALINASKFTLSEVRYLGYFQLLLGVINLWVLGYGLYFWAAGFGVLHIIYGLLMWNKYERNEKEAA